MAKDNRRIVRGVRLGGKTYTGDQEDDLQAVASSDELERLKEKGAIEGDWVSTQPTKAKVGRPKSENKTAAEKES